MAHKPHPRHVVNNWRDSDLPLAEKVRLVIKNNLIKAKTGRNCCGNHGEPGC